MKKGVFSLAFVFILLVLGACSPTDFDGSRTGNESQLIMEYKVLNTTDSQVLELQEGDYVDVVVTSTSGKIDILLQKEGDDPIYRGVDIPTSTFAIRVPKTGSYNASITGDNASGSVSIIKREGT